MLDRDFFNRDALTVARELVGKVIYRKSGGLWLSAMIIETEAYCLNEKASHSSLGYTDKRAPLFGEAGTLYMYRSRGGDSLCITTASEGDSVLLKSGILDPRLSFESDEARTMARLNPSGNAGKARPPERLCSGQALLCRSLDLKVRIWNGKKFSPHILYMDDCGYTPESLIQTRRLGIRDDRDAHLFYRFIDLKYSGRSTKDILREKGKKSGRDYMIIGKNMVPFTDNSIR